MGAAACFWLLFCFKYQNMLNFTINIDMCNLAKVFF